MKSYSLIVICLLQIASIYSAVPQIDVYVESLCPDCVDFIEGSFAEFYKYENNEQLGIVNFIPFGNAEEKWNESKQKWEFTCQHGENECYGNLIETCAINVLGRVESYEVIMCIEKYISSMGKDFDKTLQKCVTDKTKLTNIQTCVTSDIGNEYQHEMAQKTGDHSYVPWILVDGVHDTTAENKILKSLVNYLCSLPEANCVNVVYEKLFDGDVKRKKCWINAMG